MTILLFYGYELLCYLLPLAIGLCICKKYNAGITKETFLGLLIFSLYLFCIYHITGTGTLFDALRYKLELYPERINLIPFSKKISPGGYILNVLMFVPLGIFIPSMCRSLDRFSYVSAISFALSLVIEISQLLNIRSTDVDDLIMNTIGAMLGYLIFRMRKGRSTSTDSASPLTLLLCILLPLLGRFFLYNEMGAAKLLYGF